MPLTVEHSPLDLTNYVQSDKYEPKKSRHHIEISLGTPHLKHHQIMRIHIERLE
jgi:hypothetical protein